MLEGKKEKCSPYLFEIGVDEYLTLGQLSLRISRAYFQSGVTEDSFNLWKSLVIVAADPRAIIDSLSTPFATIKKSHFNELDRPDRKSVTSKAVSSLKIRRGEAVRGAAGRLISEIYYRVAGRTERQHRLYVASHGCDYNETSMPHYYKRGSCYIIIKILLVFPRICFIRIHEVREVSSRNRCHEAGLKNGTEPQNYRAIKAPLSEI